MATFTCGTCDCNGMMMIGFFVGAIFMWLLNVLLEDIDRRKKEKFNPPE